MPTGDKNQVVTNLKQEILEAMWSGDVEKCDELAPCVCCCDEHTFESCPARLWYGCRGQGAMTSAEEKSWLEHYRKNHGMTEAQFYGVEA